MALERDNSIEIAREQVVQAERQKKIALSAYFPQFDISGDYLYSNKDLSLFSEDKFAPVGTMGPQGPILDGNWTGFAYLPKEEFVFDIRDTWLGMASVTQPVYVGGKIRASNRMARVGRSIAQIQLTGKYSEVIYALEESYWQVVSLEDKVQLALSYKALVDRLSSNVEALHEEGMATKNDILKVRVRLNEVEMSLTKAENGLQLAKMALCRQVCLPLESDIVLDDHRAMPLAPPSDNSNDSWRDRAELINLGQMVEVAESKVRIARSEYLPTLGVKAGYMMSNPTPYNGFRKEFGGNFVVGVSLKMSLYHWGEVRNKVGVARSERVIANIRLKEAAEQIELQYNQALQKVEEADRRLAAAKDNSAQADENLKYALLGFEEGVVQSSGVMEALTAWYAAYSEENEARIDARLGRLNLEKVKGDLHKI